MIVFAVIWAYREAALKEKYGNINVHPRDLVYNKKVICQLLVLGFIGGWVAGALGLGGCAVFNPVLITIGLQPKVASATGTYLVVFSKISSCLVYFMTGTMQMDYGWWSAGWSIFGTICGLALMNWHFAKF